MNEMEVTPYNLNGGKKPPESVWQILVKTKSLPEQNEENPETKRGNTQFIKDKHSIELTTFIMRTNSNTTENYSGSKKLMNNDSRMTEKLRWYMNKNRMKMGSDPDRKLGCYWMVAWNLQINSSHHGKKFLTPPTENFG